jgi:DNA polymerase III delta prime subunit
VAVNPRALQTIYERIEAGKRLSKQELQTLGIAIGARAVAIEGDAHGAVIVTGDRNIVVTGANAEAIRELLLVLEKRSSTEERKKHSPVAEQLLREVKSEVTKRLQQSLFNLAQIKLGMELQPEKVKCPWNVLIKIGSQTPKNLEESTSILQVLAQAEINYELLILGNPGSGKTTTILNLAKTLIDEAEQQFDKPIPVIIELSAWQEDRADNQKNSFNRRLRQSKKRFFQDNDEQFTQPMYKWLLVQLKSKYKIPISDGKVLLKEGKLLPILDGLDEVKPSYQEFCAESINQLLRTGGSPLGLIVCSRDEEYMNLKTRLRLKGAIYLKPLTREQIDGYLNSINRQDVLGQLGCEENFPELLQTPLFLYLAILTHQEASKVEQQELALWSKQLDGMWSSYVSQMLEREIKQGKFNYFSKNENIEQEKYNKIYSSEDTLKWIVWLSQQLQKESQYTTFLIENLQSQWLSTSAQKWAYSIIVGTVVLLFLLPTSLMQGGFTSFANLAVVIIAIALSRVGVRFNFALMFSPENLKNPPKIWTTLIGIFDGWIENLRELTSLNSLWKNAFNNLGEFFSLLCFGFLVGILLYLTDGLVWGITAGILAVILVIVIIAGCVLISYIILSPIIFLLRLTIVPLDIETGKLPNSGTWKALSNLWRTSFYLGLILALGVGLFSSLIFGISDLSKIIDAEALTILNNDPIVQHILYEQLDEYRFLVETWLANLDNNELLLLVRLSNIYTDTAFSLNSIFSLSNLWHALIDTWNIRNELILLLKDLWSDILFNWLKNLWNELFQSGLIKGILFRSQDAWINIITIVRNFVISEGIFELRKGLSFGLSYLPTISLIFWMILGGGITCIQHFTLRLIFCLNDNIPWNYAYFLEQCTDRLLLQRVGGRYRFIHGTLQEHLAKMPLQRVGNDR